MIEFDKLKGPELDLINAIANRAIREGLASDKLSLEMDISAAHLDVGLKLDDLLKADKGNFGHDIGGIMRYMNRDNGKLMDGFLPRYAA